MKELSKIALAIQPSTTLAIDSMFKQMKAEGQDVVGFGAGEPDFPTPDYIKEAGIEAIRNNDTKYTPSVGTVEVRKAVCQRRINLHRLARDGMLLMHRHVFHGAHVMQAVGQLNHNYADVLRHGKEHFTVVFNLLVLFADIFDFAQLGNAVNKVGNLRAEHFRQLLQGNVGIFNNVVQKGGCQRSFVHLQLRQYRRYAQRMNNIRLTGFTALICVCFGCNVISLADKSHLLFVQIFRNHFK